MSDLLCITNRSLCKGDFLARIQAICNCHPAGIVLREKDLSEDDYTVLAQQVLVICHQYAVPCMLHSFPQAAAQLSCEALHLPLPILRQLTAAEKAPFRILGASCHSVDDAREAEALGCTYITAGHIFATDCKKGLPPRGLDFLRDVCANTSLPVYAIGGITPERLSAVKAAGAAGACVMSGTMCCEDPSAYFAAFEKERSLP